MSPQQLDLLTHARDTDPPGSHAAAAALNLTARCTEALAAIWNMRLSKPTFTDTDLAEAMNEDRNIAARRRGDLEERGLVEPVLLNGAQEMVQGKRGRPNGLWMLTEYGYVKGAELSA